MIEDSLKQAQHFIDHIGEIVGVPKAPHCTNQCFDILEALRAMANQRTDFAVDALNCHQAMWHLLKAFPPENDTTRDQKDARKHAEKCLPKLTKPTNP